ncbi:hypothetical protein TWF696_003516 [Orbilia brochopaga]|uniref:BTB domain-containing protein n=1 Tax=Orbilia brochopaga TaxID=3140254 RepID=A0AAV9TZH3_9PEZI
MNTRGTDMIVRVGDSLFPFELHRAIACQRSGLFRALCGKPKFYGQFDFPNIEKHTMKTIIRFLYCGKYDLMGSEIEYDILALRYEDRKYNVKGKVLLDYQAAYYFDIPAMKDEIVYKMAKDFCQVDCGGSILVPDLIHFAAMYFDLEGADRQKHVDMIAAVVSGSCPPRKLAGVLKAYDQLGGARTKFYRALKEFSTGSRMHADREGIEKLSSLGLYLAAGMLTVHFNHLVLRNPFLSLRFILYRVCELLIYGIHFLL